MKTPRFAVLTIAALALVQVTAALANPPRYRGGRPDYGDGFFAGISAAFASFYSTLTTSEARYNDDTIVQAAALYQDTRDMTPVWNSVSATLQEQFLAANPGAFDGMSAEEINGLIANTILAQAAQR